MTTTGLIAGLGITFGTIIVGLIVMLQIEVKVQGRGERCDQVDRPPARPIEELNLWSVEITGRGVDTVVRAASCYEVAVAFATQHNGAELHLPAADRRRAKPKLWQGNLVEHTAAVTSPLGVTSSLDTTRRWAVWDSGTRETWPAADYTDAVARKIHRNMQHTVRTGTAKPVAWLVRSPYTTAMHDQAVRQRRKAGAVSAGA